MQTNSIIYKSISFKIMNSIFLHLIFFLFISCENQNKMDSIDLNNIDESIELPALRVNNSFSQPYRILQTTISDASFFDEKYGDTDLSLGYVLRYYFYTAIDLDSSVNQLISMDRSSFNISDYENVQGLVRETISKIRKMYFGSSEFEQFIKKYFSGCVDSSKIDDNCVVPAVYDPVCGCDGFTYSNSMTAKCNGVLTYKDGTCN